MKDEIILSDTFDHVYNEIIDLNRKKVMSKMQLMIQCFLYIGVLEKS